MRPSGMQLHPNQRQPLPLTKHRIVEHSLLYILLLPVNNQCSLRTAVPQQQIPQRTGCLLRTTMDNCEIRLCKLPFPHLL